MNFAHIAAPSYHDLERVVCFAATRQTEQRVIDVAQLVSHPVCAWLHRAGLEVRHAASFYTAPKAKLPVHIDSDTFSDWCKLNLIFGGAGMMTWFSTTDEGATSLTPDGLPYTHLDPASCKILYSTKVDRSTLINPGRPHSLINFTAKPRWALSLVLGFEGQLITVQQAHEKLVSIPL